MNFTHEDSFFISENDLNDMVRQVKNGDSADLVLRIWGMKLSSKDYVCFNLFKSAIKAEIKRRAKER